MLPIWLGSSIAFVYGTVVGSFLNVCIYRLPADKSIVRPPSHCPNCSTKLKVPDLVPLASFLFLGRKCRYCGAPISWRYFVVELVAGLVFVACYLRFGFSIDFFAYAMFLAALIVAFVVDLEHLIIPDQVVFAGLAIGIARDIANLVFGRSDLSVSETNLDLAVRIFPSISGMIVCAGIFYMIAYVGYFVFRPRAPSNSENRERQESGGNAVPGAAVAGTALAVFVVLICVFLGRVLGPWIGIMTALLVTGYVCFFLCWGGAREQGTVEATDAEDDEYLGALGGGDINLAAAIGSVVGIASALTSFLIAVMLGSIVGVAHIVARVLAERKGVSWRAQIPFGPHMAVGAAVATLASPQLQTIWNAWIKLITPG